MGNLSEMPLCGCNVLDTRDAALIFSPSPRRSAARSSCLRCLAGSSTFSILNALRMKPRSITRNTIPQLFIVVCRSSAASPLPPSGRLPCLHRMATPLRLLPLLALLLVSTTRFLPGCFSLTSLSAQKLLHCAPVPSQRSLQAKFPWCPLALRSVSFAAFAIGSKRCGRHRDNDPPSRSLLRLRQSEGNLRKFCPMFPFQ